MKIAHHILLMAAVISMASCVKAYDFTPSAPENQGSGKKVGFDITVTREGESVASHRTGITTRSTVGNSNSGSGAYASVGSSLATMDADIPFGLVGIDYFDHEIVVDNARVSSDGRNYSTYFNDALWNEIRAEKISFSAYYPFVDDIQYGDDLQSYSIPYKAEDTEAGPLVSKTVEVAVSRLSLVPLEFQHITNDIGYCVADVTPDSQLQGLIHLRKVIAHNVASAGIFMNDMNLNQGVWHRQGYYRDIVIFEGDALVGVGMENEKFVGFDTLEDHLADSHRYYSIPDEIVPQKQYVEVVFDVDGFYVENYYYEPLKDQVKRFQIYGVIPGNKFAYGRQYTFHLGLDLSSIYQPISFTAGVSDWETQIYEDNEVF